MRVDDTIHLGPACGPSDLWIRDIDYTDQTVVEWWLFETGDARLQIMIQHGSARLGGTIGALCDHLARTFDAAVLCTADQFTTLRFAPDGRVDRVTVDYPEEYDRVGPIIRSAAPA